MNYDELTELYHSSFPYDLREDGTIKSFFGDKTSTAFTREDEHGRIIGAALLHKNTIYCLMVRREYRGRGIGSSLLAECEKTARANGYDKIKIGAGDSYLMPGVPTNIKPFDEALAPDRLYSELDNSAVEFLTRRGYYHSNSDSNIFDMRMRLDEFTGSPIRLGEELNGIVYRAAVKEDLDRITSCTDDALEHFTQYYNSREMYPDSAEDYAELLARDEIVIGAFDGDCAAGALIVDYSSESIGSIGCTSVRHAYRGRGIATQMVRLGVLIHKDRGLDEAFLGYTYSGLDKMYGASGFKACVYYFMAEKAL